MFSEQSLEKPEAPKIQFESDENGFVMFGDVSRKLLKKQSQYGSRYLGGWEQEGYPNLATGLRLQGDPEDYHNVMIHQDDITEFIKRFEAQKI